MEHASGDAAERYAFHTVLLRQLQTGAVAGSQQAFVFWGHTALNDGADGMRNIVAGKVVA